MEGLDAAEHRPVLLTEAVDCLELCPDAVVLDVTFGRGGHSREILRRLGPKGKLLAVDRDPEAVACAQQIADPRLHIIHGAFSNLQQYCQAWGHRHVDAILADLGVSSPQLDSAARGFSFRLDAPLDMRMDPSEGKTAAQFLAYAEEREISQVLWRYGEERFARRIAAAIVRTRQESPIQTTLALAKLVESVSPFRGKQHAATRCFQALRIWVNQELSQLEKLLEIGPKLLAVQGCMGVISFHSLEDRLVKHCFRHLAQADHTPIEIPLRHADIVPADFEVQTRKAIRPSAAEVSANPRSRSASLRVLMRVKRTAS